jgi:glucosamine-6-phosphate deaminase
VPIEEEASTFERSDSDSCVGEPAVIISVFKDKRALGRAASEQAADALRDAILDRRRARIVVATGASQLEFLDALTKREDIDWQRVEMFHLDEYIGLPITHPASFRNYLLKNFIRKTGLTKYHLLDGDGDAREAAQRTGESLNAAPIDIAFVGIGENGHLAFNDPPADFESDEPYLIVSLDDACRQQQVGEGWFADISEVPRQAISMSVRQIMKAREILVVVPDARKAEAVRLCCEGEIGPMAPASILRTHAGATVYLDEESASLLNAATLHAYAAKE